MKEIEIVQAKLKHKVEDFIVEEIGDKWDAKVSKDFAPNTNPDLSNINLQEPKEFLWLELEKKDIDHFTIIKELTRLLNKRVDEIGYAGTKDKKAWTSQRISIFQPNIERIKNFKHLKITLKNFKWNKRKIKMGYLEGNHFKIILRDIDKKDAMKIPNQIKKKGWFPNYFGHQRFGINENNIKIGKLILKRKFKEAVREISNDNFRQKEKLDYHLSKNHNDFLEAIKRVDKKNMLMYIHSVQSKIFNEILELALEEELNFTKQGQTSCLLIGYKTRFFNGRLGEIEQQVLASHNLILEDFDIQEIPYLRIKGSFRKAITEIKDLQIKIENDDKFENSKKIILEFTLPSGVYATTFLDNFFTLI